MDSGNKVEVLRFDFGDQDYIVKNDAEGWASFYEVIGPQDKVVVTIERWSQAKLDKLPEWGN